MKTPNTHNNDNKQTFARQAFPDTARLAVQGLTAAVLEAVRAKGGSVTDEMETRVRASLLRTYRMAEEAQSRSMLDSVAAGIDELSLVNQAGMLLLRNVAETGSPFLLRNSKGEITGFSLKRRMHFQILDLIKAHKRSENAAMEADRQQGLGGCVKRPDAASMKTLRAYLMRVLDCTLQDVSREMDLSICDIRRPIYRLLPELIESLTGIQGASPSLLLGPCALSGTMSASGVRLLNNPEFRRTVSDVFERNLREVRATAATERRKRMENATAAGEETADNGSGESIPAANDESRRARKPHRKHSARAMQLAA